MDDAVIVRHLENLDRRLAIAEQILPRLEIQVSTPATKDDLRAEFERLHRHIDIVGKALHSDIQLLAEHLASVMPKGTGASS